MHKNSSEIFIDTTLYAKVKTPYNLLGASFQKPAGAKPVRVSAFIGVSILFNIDSLAVIAMPARASNSIDTPMNAETLTGFAPKGPWSCLWKVVPTRA